MHRTRLFLELEGEAGITTDKDACQAADGLVIDPATVTVEQSVLSALEPDTWVLGGSGAEAFAEWRERDRTVWACDKGLEETTRLRDKWPDLCWIPKVGVFKSETRYAFCTTYHDEGFKYYVPDPATIRAYRVDEDDLDLDHWLTNAAKMGFHTVWLHASDAEAKGRGLELDLLERVRRHFCGELWLSGGATGERHLATFAAEGGAGAVIIPLALARRCGTPTLRRTLYGPLPVDAPVFSECPIVGGRSKHA